MAAEIDLDFSADNCWAMWDDFVLPQPYVLAIVESGTIFLSTSPKPSATARGRLWSRRN